MQSSAWHSSPTGPRCACVCERESVCVYECVCVCACVALSDAEQCVALKPDWAKVRVCACIYTCGEHVFVCVCVRLAIYYASRRWSIRVAHVYSLICVLFHTLHSYHRTHPHTLTRTHTQYTNYALTLILIH
jgi:hypothetical protein